MKSYKLFFTVFMAVIVTCLFSCGNHEHTQETNTHDHSSHSHNHAHSHDHNGHNHNHSGHNHDHSGHNHNHSGHNHAHKHQSTAKVENHAADVHNHSEEINFTDNKAAHFGVESKKVTFQPFNNIIKVSGQIVPAQGDLSVIVAKSSGVLKLNGNAIVGKQLSVGTSIGFVSSQDVAGGDVNEVAKINYEAAKRELDRITPLYNDKIVTEKDYNLAKQMYEQAKVALVNNAGAGSAATSNISGTLTEMYKRDGEFVEVGTAIAQVSKNKKLILKADLPVRYASFAKNVKSANFRTSYSDQIYDLAKMNGRIVSNENISVVTPGYIPLNFEFNNTESIVPGSYADIYLVGESKPNCIVLPIGAITEEQGYYFVYVKVHPEMYAKKEVKLGVNNGDMVEVLSGLQEGEEVVTKGAVFVKLASQEGAAPGHSHEH